MSLEIIKAENLDDMITMLEENFLSALNNQAPEETKVIKVRKKKPWFGNELKLLKSLQEGKKYSRNTDYNLAGLFLTVNEKVQKDAIWCQDHILQYTSKRCKGDMKELYKLVNTLMGTTSSNPLPNHTNDKLLANEFTDFFMNNIQKIRDNLTESPVYQPPGKKHTKSYRIQTIYTNRSWKNHLQYEDQVIWVGCSAK